MYAVVVHVTIHDQDEAKHGLDEDIIPTMKGAPGFVGAYFVALENNRGVAVQVFQTEEQARPGAPPEGSAGRGVTIESVQFGEVIGAA